MMMKKKMVMKKKKKKKENRRRWWRKRKNGEKRERRQMTQRNASVITTKTEEETVALPGVSTTLARPRSSARSGRGAVEGHDKTQRDPTVCLAYMFHLSLPPLNPSPPPP